MKNDNSFHIAAIIILAGVILSCFGPAPAPAEQADAASVAAQSQTSPSPAATVSIFHLKF